ncbi:VG15 protein [Rhodococcus sp. PD04]|uniref:VG15 protein n=1 Tax=Rhodococcus sp. PD04 TaxID=3109594 RepID=UPI002DDA9442|nr:hypothetical protein [Rhodococcus sp. PD04]WSE22334.1 hypothetical protein U9J23_22210 [Rhodococcus sp. PD04]
MTTLVEERAILDQLHELGVANLEELWKLALASEDPFAYLVAAYPELAAQYATAAADAAAVWYDEAPGGIPGYVAVPAEVAPAAQYAGSAQWALASTGEKGFEKLAGALQGDIWDAARNTKILNAELEPGSTFAREAGPKACPFCRMLATRGAVYTSRESAGVVVGRGKEMSESDRRARARGENRDRRHRFLAGGQKTRGNQKLGKKFHDHCHCRIVEVRAGETYRPPDYALEWEEQYKAAALATEGTGKYGAVELKPLMKTWRGQDTVRKADALDRATKELDTITDLDELGARAVKAIEDEDFELLDRIDARETALREQITKREATAAAAREKRAAAAEAKRAKQDADYDRHIAEGKSGEEAIELAYGITVEQQRREAAISSLRSSGYSGKGFDELTRNAYTDVVHDEWLAAENALTFLVRKEYASKVDPRELWRVNETTARKWATPELLEWWDEHGRTTLDGYRAGLLGGTQSRAAGGAFLQ